MLRLFSILLLLPICGLCQVTPESPVTKIDEILDRLTKLENENRMLLQEVRALREQLTAGTATPSIRKATSCS